MKRMSKEGINSKRSKMHSIEILDQLYSVATVLHRTFGDLIQSPENI